MVKFPAPDSWQRRHADNSFQMQIEILTLTALSALTNSPVAGQSLENVITGVPAETISQSEQGGSMKEEDATVIEQALQDRSSNIHELSDSFVQWVIHGETLCNCT
ncbi:uncharacterized protein LOC116257966 isoform X5 [Nymphaea colorata]|uniref:uncharacterized protein LOC116257966 isoform X5 n=1 Tax=Nymphaea colorata TaxID=210225 RepID=UPI00129D68BA|nr:uncharacterized protein LOC116257966 isoform X5 [Nymphaea colorata]